MEKLKQSLKDIKARKQRRGEDNSNNPKLSNEKETTESEQKESKEFLQLPEGDEPTERLHGGKRGRKRIFQRIADSFKAKQNANNDNTPSKKRKMAGEGDDTQTPSTSGRVSDLDGEPPSAKRSKKNTNKSQKSRGIEEEESPKPLKGLEKRRMQKREIREMNKKNIFYKDKDVKNRRQNKR